MAKESKTSTADGTGGSRQNTPEGCSGFPWTKVGKRVTGTQSRCFCWTCLTVTISRRDAVFFPAPATPTVKQRGSGLRV